MKIQEEYRETIKRVYQLLNTCPAPEKTEGDDDWSVKQLLGHLLDSASNNHQRFLRYHPHALLEFPGYDQEQFVERSHYATIDFQTLLTFWYQYNQLILHVVSHISAEHATSTIKVGDNPVITLDELFTDYFAHMEMHEGQIRRIMER